MVVLEFVVEKIKKENKKLIKLMIAEEKKFGLYKSNIYKLINKEIKNSKDLLKNFILKEIKKIKKLIFLDMEHVQLGLC